jgi:DNA-binding response OmpR family regulator
MDNRPLVLVADDQAAITRLVSLTLKDQGFRVETVHDGSSAIERVTDLNPDILVLDVLMPGQSGLEVIRELRETHPLPIILLSERSAIADVSTGLDLGADDYLAKPFHPDELGARIRAVLRRRRHLLRGRRRIGPTVADLDTGRLTRGGRSVQLSRREWILLEELLAREGAVVLHEELLTAAFGPSYRDDVAYLRLWISQLRRRLGVPAWEEGPIRTIPGLGYCFDPTGSIPRMRSRRPRAPEVRRSPESTPGPDQIGPDAAAETPSRGRAPARPVRRLARDRSAG